MLMNKILFPAPKPADYTLTSHGQHLFWLPDSSTNASHVPCMFYSPNRSRNNAVEHFIIWCHGNGVDIGTMHHTMRQLTEQLHAHIVIFEYPSYGLCTTSSPNKKSINAHADRVYAFVRDTLQWPPERIVVYGHSIGSGVACHIASTYPVGALILQSPYTSVKNLVKEKVGVLSLLVGSGLWDNLEVIKHTTCPVLFMHGQLDTLIPPEHSQILHDTCPASSNRKKIVILENDDHNSIRDEILITHVKPFLGRHVQSPLDTSLPGVRIDDLWRKQPQEAILTSSSSARNVFTSLGQSLSGLSRASASFTTSTLQSLSGRQENKTEKDEQQ